MKYFIGIDPGWTGAIAYVSECSMKYGTIKCPAHEADIWRCYMNDGGLNLLDAISADGGKALIENVHAFPPGKASPNTRFRLGWNYGAHRMALTAAGIPWDGIAPGKWQQSFSLKGLKGLTDVQKKNAHKAKAQQLFPNEEVIHQTADALLIAEYCRRFELGLG